MSAAAEWLDRVDALAREATEGPWEAEYSKPTGHCVIPHDAQSTLEAVAVTRLYRASDDAEFIAASRTAVPAMSAALRAVLDLHYPEKGWVAHLVPDFCGVDGRAWPCPTVRAITEALT